MARFSQLSLIIGKLYQILRNRDNIFGGNTAVWRAESDPHGCEGNVGELIDLPTPAAPAATPTASVTPWVPPYAGATRAP